MRLEGSPFYTTTSRRGEEEDDKLRDIDFRVHEATEGYCIATWRRVMFLVWKGVATVEGIERSRQIMEPWSRRHREGVMLVIVMATNFPSPPSDEAREAMSRSTSVASNLKGIAVIYQGNWFVLAGIRGVTATRALIDRGRVPTRIFGKLEDAAPWISTCLGTDHTAYSLAVAATNAGNA